VQHLQQNGPLCRATVTCSHFSLCSLFFHLRRDASRTATPRTHVGHPSECNRFRLSPIPQSSPMTNGEDVPMDPPPALPGPSGTKRKRQSGNSPVPEPEPEAGSLRAKRPRLIAPQNRVKKPKRPSDWHLRKGEIPKEAEKNKVRICLLPSQYITDSLLC